MDNNIETAKAYLNKVGAALMHEMKQDPAKAASIKRILVSLKEANNAINNLNEDDDSFSFDSIGSNERVREQISNKDMGVDLGDFDQMISAPKDTGAWKNAFKEGNSNGGVNIDGIDLSAAPTDSLGRMIDNT